MPELSQPTQKLIQRYQAWYQSLQKKPGVSTIHVDEVASKVAAFYEKIRGIIDWKEEHLFRQTAIRRGLKRRLLISREKNAAPLVYELIRGGHFPNDRIEESKIKEVQKLIDKYVFILENAPKSSDEKLKIQLRNWILEVAACELEETLAPPLREKALMDYMTELIKERVEVKEGIFVIDGIKEEEKNTQIYIAVQRALFKLDTPLISYYLLKRRYLNWANFPQDQLTEIAQNIYSIWESIKKDLSHPLADKFYQICEKYDTPYLLLGDILSEDPMKIQEKISKPENLENSTKRAYLKRLSTLKSRLGRAAVFATLSIFITNIVSLLAVEIPATKILTGQFNWLAIGVDILGPTLLMAFLVITIKPPQKGNLERVIMETSKIVYEKERKDVYEVRVFPKRGFLIRAIITLFYLLSFFVSFGLIIWGLYQVNFPPLSHPIFIIFISLIAFAGAKIRERSKELEVTITRRTFFGFLMDLFSLPFLRFGKWLSERWEKYNVIATFFSSLIDMPFQLFVEFLEHWSYFLKEKKEAIH